MKKLSGFTLIEIVIVLAIAALIMSIVFVAVSGAQRAQRDNHRKSDANQIFSLLQTYAGNNNSLYPNNQSTLDSFVSNYVTSLNLKDPSNGKAYVLTYSTGPLSANASFKLANPERMGYAASADCQNSNIHIISPQNLSKVALVAVQENGGTYCVNN